MNDTVARKIRLLMILRRSGITDHRVLSAIERVPREAFVPETFADQAYDDIALPIGLGQTISQPQVVGHMTQLLKAGDRHKILEIGTGSGFQAAVLAKLCRRLYTIERHKALQDRALEILDRIKVRNVTARVGNGLYGWPEQAPFDRIIVTAGHQGTEPPQHLVDQLANGGIMVIPMGDTSTSQWTYRVVRTEGGHEAERLWRVRFVPLVPDPVEQSPRTRSRFGASA